MVAVVVVISPARLRCVVLVFVVVAVAFGVLVAVQGAVFIGVWASMSVGRVVLDLVAVVMAVVGVLIAQPAVVGGTP